MTHLVDLSVTVKVESLMRRYVPHNAHHSISSLNYYLNGVKASSGPEPKTQLLIEQFTPGQQLALMELRGNALTIAILAKLRRSTAVQTPTDKAALLEQRLAVRRASGNYVLTPQGVWMASRLAAELAREFNIDPIHHKPRTRGAYTPGVKASFSYW